MGSRERNIWTAIAGACAGVVTILVSHDLLLPFPVSLGVMAALMVAGNPDRPS